MTKARSVSSYFQFRVADVSLLCPVDYVDGVTVYETPVALPRVPEHILGVVTYDQRALAVVDFHRFLQLPANPVPHYTKTLVLSIEDYQVGVPADAAHGIVSVTSDSAAEDATLLAGRLEEFTSAEYETQHGRAGLLRLDQLLEAARV